MKHTCINSYSAFARHVVEHNRDIHGDDANGFLGVLASAISERVLDLRQDTTLWRAQVGCDPGVEEYNGDVYNVAVPYDEKRMIPDPLLVGENRVSPKGIACLYLSTDKETAMSEVRPWIGTILSLAKFNITRDLKIVDCSKSHGQKNAWLKGIPAGDPSFKIPEETILRKIWSDVDSAFSVPVSRNEDTTRYIPTQVIAEFIKSKKFDGLAYKSALSESGYNVALFDLEAAHFVRPGYLFETTTLKISFAELSYFGYPTTVLS
jgi:hypothetical protein